MRIYGLTGGIGSGKSEAGRVFQGLGIPVIDADRIGHLVLAPGGAGVEAVVGAFGGGILNKGVIDRVTLGALVFEDETARVKLNSIVHPLIMMEIGRQCAGEAEKGTRAVLVEAALLGERGSLDPVFAGLVLVLCPEELRIERLMASRGMTESEARARMATQTAPELKRPLATWVIDNEGDLEHLREQVSKIAAEMTRVAM